MLDVRSHFGSRRRAPFVPKLEVWAAIAAPTTCSSPSPSGPGRVPEFLWVLSVSGRFPWASGWLSQPPGPTSGSVFLWRPSCRQNLSVAPSWQLRQYSNPNKTNYNFIKTFFKPIGTLLKPYEHLIKTLLKPIKTISNTIRLIVFQVEDLGSAVGCTRKLPGGPPDAEADDNPIDSTPNRLWRRFCRQKPSCNPSFVLHQRFD